jgi:hypothetical protein
MKESKTLEPERPEFEDKSYDRIDAKKASQMGSDLGLDSGKGFGRKDSGVLASSNDAGKSLEDGKGL